MEFLSHPVVAIILLLGVLIIVHEAGHFLVGKASGIAVEIFSIGFGPVLLSFKSGPTAYRLSLIPLGGFVKFYGALRSEKVPDEVAGQEYFRASLPKRIATVAAGPLANFLLAIFVYAAMGFHGISLPPPVVGEIMPNSPAAAAGLQFGDIINEINGVRINTWKDLRKEIVQSPGEKISLTIDREGNSVFTTITPKVVLGDGILPKKPQGQIGISPLHVPAVVRIKPGSVAAKLGLLTGDKIISIEMAGKNYSVLYWRVLVKNWSELLTLPQEKILLTLQRPTSVSSSAQTQQVVVEISKSTKLIALEEMGITGAHLVISDIKNLPNSALKPLDEIVKWGEKHVFDAFSLREAIDSLQQPEVTITVNRQEVLEQVKVSLKPVEIQKPEGKSIYYTFPVSFLAQLEEPKSVIERYYTPWSAIGYGIKETGTQTLVIAGAVYGLITGDVPLQALGGPISIAKVASDSVKMGWMTFLSALALISINLGLLNLFPIPVLDGGQLVLLFTEGLRRRPLSELAIENFQRVGFVMVLALVVMATYNDFGRFWSSILEEMTGFFE